MGDSLDDAGAEFYSLERPHEEAGRCPLGDECPCWQEGWADAMAVVEGRTVRMPSPNDCPDSICHAKNGMPAACFAEELNHGALYADEFIGWPAGDRCPMLDVDDDPEGDAYLADFLAASNAKPSETA